MSKAHLPATTTLLALLLLLACSPQEPQRVESLGVDNPPGTSSGITVFGDARLGAAIGGGFRSDTVAAGRPSAAPTRWQIARRTAPM